MDLPTIVLVLILVLNIGLSLLVILSNPKKTINQLFLLFIFSVCIWIISNYYANFNNIYSLMWAKYTFLGATLVGFTLVCFAFYFPRLEKKIEWWKEVVIVGSTFFVVCALFFSDKIIAGVNAIPGGMGVEQGGWYILWSVYFIPLVLYGIFILFSKYRLYYGKEKEQLKFVFTGLVFSFLFAITTNLIFPLVFKNDSISYIGPYATIIFIGFTAFAIVKHEFLNIKVVATETLVVAINIALLFNLLYSETFNRGLTNGAILLFSILAGYLLINTVINDIRQKEQLQILTTQLAKANAHLKDLDKMKTEFVSLASHELLTPVSAIEGYLSMILDEHLAKVDDPKAAQYLDRIYRSSKRLARLISDMLNISRIEEGRLLVEKKDVNLTELVNQVIEEVKFKAEEKKQRVVFQPVDNQISRESDNQKDSQSSNHPIIQSSEFMTYADPDKIKEVIINLVGNSIKYSKNPGTIIINIEKVPTDKINQTWSKIEADVKEGPLDDQEAIHAAVDDHFRQILGDEQLLISVKDEGIGIPKDELPKLFKKFHRVGDYTTAESQGTGLGLYISRALVELHHGRIWPTSEGPGKGSKFYFSLPDITSKEEIVGIEKQVQQDKEQLKPLAKPMSEKKGDI